MVSVLILEDEEYTRRYLGALVSEHPLVNHVYMASGGGTAIHLAGEHTPEIALLDIELGKDEELNGIEVARLITATSPTTQIVFITGYAKYALSSFLVHPYDFIVKPIRKDRVIQVISDLVKRVGMPKACPKMSIKTNDGTVFISLDEVYFVEKQGKRICMHCQSGIQETTAQLKDIENILPDNFKRVHKSFIINMNKLHRVRDLGNRSYEVTFAEYGRTALMSRYKFEEFKQMFSPSL